MADPPTERELLRHETAVRALALALVRDAGEAEDVVQETWLAALRRPPGDRTRLGGWLAAVARNLSLRRRRTRARRERLHHAARREGAAPSAADLAARLEIEERIVAAVRSLAEPGRTAIVLRYFEGLGPAGIAGRLGVPVRTVESRLRRGLERLRDDLDDLHGGDRRAWALALVPLLAAGRKGASGARAALPGIGVLVMTGKQLLLVAIATVLVVAVAAVAFWPRENQSAPPAPPPADGSLPPAAPEPAASAPEAPPPAESRPPAAEAAAATVRVEGRVVDGAGAPVPAAFVWADAYAPNYGTGRLVIADGEGTYAINLAPGEHMLKARAPGTAPGSAPVAVEEGRGALAALDLVLTEGGVIRGKVVDAAGRPRPFVRVRCWAEEGDEYTELLRDGRRLMIGGDDVSTGADGAFALRGLEDVPHKVLPDLLYTPGLVADPPEVKGVHPGGEPLRFTVRGETVLAGVVRDARTDEPVTLFAANGRPFTGPDGRFEVPGKAGEPFVVEAPGYEKLELSPADLERDPATGEAAIRLTPDPDAGTLVLVALDEGGAPLPEVTVQDSAPDYHMWTFHRAAPGNEWRIRPLAPGSHVLYLEAPGFASASAKMEIPARGEARLTVRLSRAGRIRIRGYDEKGNVLKFGELVVRDGQGHGPACRFDFTEPQGTAMSITHWFMFASEDGTSFNLSTADGTLSGLPPGEYTLTLKRKGSEKSVSLRLEAGGEKEVAIRLGD